jgi:hypothetical protein
VVVLAAKTAALMDSRETNNRVFFMFANSQGVIQVVAIKCRAMSNTLYEAIPAINITLSNALFTICK